MKADTDKKREKYRFKTKAIIAISEFDIEEAKKLGHNIEDDYYYPCDVHFEISGEDIKIIGIDNQMFE